MADVPDIATRALRHYLQVHARQPVVPADLGEVDREVLVEAGASAFAAGVLHPLVDGLPAATSPGDAVRAVVAAGDVVAAGGAVELVDTARSAATVRVTWADPATARPACDLLRGVLRATPSVAGLPHAVVSHARCQTEGAAACVYLLTWHSTPTLSPWDDGVAVAALGERLTVLQDAAADLAAVDDRERLLDRVVDLAVRAGVAPAVVVVPKDDDDPWRACGVPHDRAAEVARQVRAGADPGPDAAVVELSSSRGRYGWLVGLDGVSSDAEDRLPLLTAWARQASATLDLVGALRESRAEAARTAALLTLAHELTAATTGEAVGAAVARAVPAVVGCPAVAVLLWDPATALLRTSAVEGLPDAEAMRLETFALRPDRFPELASLVGRREGGVKDVTTSSPELEPLLRAVGADVVLAVPLVAGDELVGVVAGAWTSQDAPDSVRSRALDRLTAVAEQAGTALQNARLRQTVRHQAGHDALTGLANRGLFGMRLDQTLRAVRGEQGTSVLVCDIDGFKGVNSTYGHQAGDELLRQAAARLSGEVRGSDVVARLSADEFAVLMVDMEEPEAVSVATRLVDRLDEPFRIEGHEVRVTVSVGVSVHVGADGRGDVLLADADQAMRVAKSQGRNQVVVADGTELEHRVPSLETELAEAVGAGQLRLFFQPLVGIESGQTAVVGAEALLRWAHPRLGLLAPAAFLPLAEETGLIRDLDLWSVEEACRTLGALGDAGSDLRLAVNVSSGTLTDPRLVPAVRAAVSRHRVAADRIHLEIVESRSLMDLPGVVEAMRDLRHVGVRLSLDDFGTGYSTLAWLHSLPVDQIKIDRSFVMRLPADEASASVVRGVLALAREMAIEVVAEGVEESAQLEALRDAGCTLVQGYFLGRPAPVLATELRPRESSSAPGAPSAPAAP